MIDIEPATAALSRLVAGVSDDQLPDPTPCQNTVADLLEHVNGFSLGFSAAAAKTEPPSGASSSDGSGLGTDWRTRIPAQLDALAAAWRAEDAWSGMTKVGGLELPGEVAAAVAINEVLVHGWDLARATGQRLDPDPAMVETAYPFVEGVATRSPDGSPGLFGPVVAIPDDAPRFEQLLGLAGRDPQWSPE
ncbi:MAG: TIGR03086 family metal-binding protein [Acidimicrobiales bacterium]